MDGSWLTSIWKIERFERLAGGEWVRDGDDRTAKCEASGAIPDATARGERGETGVVEVSNV